MEFAGNSKPIRRVVLLNPPLPAEKLYGRYLDWGGVYPPVGLCYLAAVLRKNHFDVIILDAEAEQKSVAETTAAVLAHHPDLVGITCKTLWLRNAHAVAEKLKSEAPKLPIVVGGNHVTAMPRRSLLEFSHFDSVVIGEGEVTLLELIDALNVGRSLSEVRGIAFRSQDGEIVETPMRERISDLDTLPMPAYDLLPDIPTHYRVPVFQTRKYPSFWWVTSRGCPGKCTFCDRTVFGRRVTYHSPEYIMDTAVSLCAKHPFKHFMFDDDSFLANKEHARRLLRLLKKEKLGFTFTCNTRVDHVDADILKELKQAGCYQVTFGIESGSQQILDAMHKRITPEQVERAVHLIKRAGLRTYGFVMLGFPGETEATLKETYDLIRRCPIDDVGVFLFTPLPGTEVYEQLSVHGRFVEDWSKMNSLSHAVFVPEGLTESHLLRELEHVVDGCYMKWRQLFRLPLRITSWTHLKIIFKTFTALSK